ncbi:FRIGIDA-like protein 4a [Zingiber officinale]|uniref:FRIGIDA-like protein 4a n=1 Tax=Zingiber officinale TaxID=94328 RepID=UPI001C4BFCCB|nr:FRIGIDA-like protein 4a [Zingiber officinale]
MAAQALASDRINEHLSDLEAQRALLDNCIFLWKSLSNHWNALHLTVAERSQAFDADLQSLDSRTQRALDSISERESSLCDREFVAAATIRERRDAVLAEIEQPDARGPPAAKSDLRGLLRWYARRMDSAGLWRFVASRRKALCLLWREITDAIDESVDPSRLVIDAVEDFLIHPIEDGKDRNWALGMLLHSLLGSDGTKCPDVAESIRERAVAVAESWKEKFGLKTEEGEREEPMGGSEAQIFLQMVATFGLRSRFEEDFLLKLITEHASRKEMAKLATAMGFREQLSVVIDKLIKTEKEIEAIYFVHQSGLIDRFPPESLLKMHLESSKKKSNSILKDGNNSPAALQESSNLEITALRSIMKCVEICNLESKFNTTEIKRRLAVLEKAKANSKKPAVSKKSHGKRPISIGATAPFHRAKAARTSNTPHASFSRNPLASRIPPAHHS